MSSKFLSRLALGAYLIIFFSYLLGPLLVMSLTAFNSSKFPSVSPWACFTFEWYTELFNDDRILTSIINSLKIGLGTVILSVSMGLAASLVLTQVWPRLRTTYYTLIIAPILVPGVVLGISTVVFWDKVGRMFGPSAELFFHNGLLLTILGQSTFIASYCMLVFVARLQRFDTGLTEAALDLGATHTQAFRKILLPFMRPAIASAAVLAFLASFENYNTTTFTFGNYPTLTIELAQKVRYGINPSISSLAFIIIAVTVFGALAVEAIRRNSVRKEAIREGKAVAKSGSILPGFLRGNPAAFMFVILSIIAITMVGTAQSHDPKECKAQVLLEKKAEIAIRIEALRQQRLIKDQSEARQGPDIFSTPDADAGDAVKTPSGSGAFGGVFAPTNLDSEDSE